MLSVTFGEDPATTKNFVLFTDSVSRYSIQYRETAEILEKRRRAKFFGFHHHSQHRTGVYATLMHYLWQT
jgi:hypothetical protein